MVFEVRREHYKDLSETLSEKNVINKVSGKEYLVRVDSSSVIQSVEIETGIFNDLFNIDANEILTPKYNANLKKTSKKQDIIYFFQALSIYLRTETFYSKGVYEFKVPENTDISKGISLSFELQYYYIKSTNQIINKDNYNNDGVSAYLSNKKLPTPEHSSKNKYLWNLSSKFIWQKTPYGPHEYIATIKPYSEQEYIRSKIVKKVDGTYIQIEYNVRTWYTYNETFIPFIGSWEYENGGYAVNKIKVDVLSTAITTESLDFEHNTSNIQTERKYTLETNELLQYDETKQLEEQQSFLNAQKIFESYDIDRRIISFDMIDPVRAIVDDSEIYTNSEEDMASVQIERFLDTDDQFKIFDINNKSMGEFIVLKSEPIWDGSYHKLITAILVKEPEVN